MSLVTPDFGLIFWMTLIFAIVFFILAKFGFPMITKMVQKRNDYIEKSLKDAKEAEARLANIAQESEKMMEEARKEHSRIINEAAAMRDEILFKAKEDASLQSQKIVAEAALEIEARKENALRELRLEAAKVSVEMAEKLVRKTLADPAEQAQLIDRLVEEAENNSK